MSNWQRVEKGYRNGVRVSASRNRDCLQRKFQSCPHFFQKAFWLDTQRPFLKDANYEVDMDETVNYDLPEIAKG